MSARRKFLRRKYASDVPAIFNRANKLDRRAEFDAGARVYPHGAPMKERPIGKRIPFHAWAVLKNHRHPRFQLRLHNARVELGLSATSGNMHRAHGKAL